MPKINYPQVIAEDQEELKMLARRDRYAWKHPGGH
jgi:hypothetical protein